MSKQYTKDLPQLPYSVALNFDEIQFNTDVIIKCNHECMWHIYYINKEFYNNQYQKITKEEAKQYINEKLKIKYSSVFNPKFQWAYYYIQPMLLVEQFIGRNIGDIKLHIFKGQVTFIKYYKDRIGKTKIEIYDKDWIFQTNIHSWSKHELASQSINKPQQLDYIIEWASKHLQHIDYCRLDFLYKDDKLWFNEITLYHGNGLRKIEPYSFDLNLGKLWNLKINNTLVPNLHIPDIANDTPNDTPKGTTIIYKQYNINNDTR